MTLDKAITDLETEYKSDFNRQLAEWLRQFKEIKRQQDRIIQILDDCDLEAWEILEKIKEVVRA